MLCPQVDVVKEISLTTVSKRGFRRKGYLLPDEHERDEDDSGP